jgi:hypothetical protein
MAGVDQLSNLVQGRLQEDGLSGLSALLARHGMGIAGSYVLPNHTANPESVPDVDVWIPTGANHRQAVADVASFLFLLGYPFPHSYRALQPLGTATYTRFSTVIDTIYTFRSPGKRTVQVLSTQANVASSMAEVVAGFDLVGLHQYFDGRACVATEAARRDSDDLAISINLSDPRVRYQTLAEWVRTGERIRKYQDRGFGLRDTVERDLAQSLVDTLCALPLVYSAQGGVSVRNERLVHRWNTVVRGLRWNGGGTGPLVSLVNSGEGCTVASLQWQVHTPDGPPAIAPVICPEGLREGTTVRWRGSVRLVVALTPAPPLCAVPAGTLVATADMHVFDHLQAEDVPCGEFVQRDPANNLIVFAGVTPNTLTRHQLDRAPTFTVGPTGQGACHDCPELTAVQLPSGNFYVPTAHVLELLQTPGSGVVQLVQSGTWWDYAREVGHGRGSRSLSIHFFRRLPLRDTLP